MSGSARALSVHTGSNAAHQTYDWVHELFGARRNCSTSYCTRAARALETNQNVRARIASKYLRARNLTSIAALKAAPGEARALQTSLGLHPRSVAALLMDQRLGFRASVGTRPKHTRLRAGLVPFIIFASYRTGSCSLVQALLAAPMITCYGEIFKRGGFPQANMTGPIDPFQAVGVQAALRKTLKPSGAGHTGGRVPLGHHVLQSIDRFWTTICPAGGACGFKLFWGQIIDHRTPREHDVGNISALFDNPWDVRAIILRRLDRVAEYSSWVRAMVTGDWVPNRTDLRVVGRRAEVTHMTPERYQNLVDAWYYHVWETCRHLSVDVLNLTTEEMASPGGMVKTVARVASFLGLPSSDRESAG